MSDAAAAVLITGASSGIGAALARAYAKRGARLGLLEGARRHWPSARAFCRGASGAGRGRRRRAADGRGGEAFRVAIRDSDVVTFANAGVSVGTLTEYASDLTAFEKVLRTNLLGMVSTFQPFVGPCASVRSGRLVGIASVAGIRGLPGVGLQRLQGGGDHYLESLRVEMHGSGVKVVTVAPGYIRTPMTDANDFPMPFLMAPDAAAAQILRMVDAGRRYGVLPWQMALVARLLRMVPRPLFDRVFARAGRKPRGLLR